MARTEKIELVRESSRNIARRHAKPNSVAKLAVVLSPPIYLSNTAARQLYGDSSDPFKKALGAATANQISRFLFKARVLSDGPQSWNPHERIDDPCNLSTTDKLETAIELVRLHTTFISPIGYNGEPIKVGDYVAVRFHHRRQPGSPEGCCDTAEGDLIEKTDALVQATPSLDLDALNSDGECKVLADAFANSDLIGSAALLPPGSDISAPPSPAATSDSSTEKPEIIKACEAKGHVMYDDGKVNLIGVRAHELRSSNQFVDRFFIAWKEGGRWQSRGYPCTTKPGRNLFLRPKHSRGAPILKLGQYPVYQIDAHGKPKGTEQPLRNGRQSPLYLGENKGYMALCQRAGNVTVYRDNTRDDVIHGEQHPNPGQETTGAGYGINIHRAWKGPTPPDTNNLSWGNPPTESWSEGCQVFKNRDDFVQMMSICIAKANLMPQMEGRNQLTRGGRPRVAGRRITSGTFTYTLINYEDYDVENDESLGFQAVHKK
jgi:hypothetical protein